MLLQLQEYKNWYFYTKGIFRKTLKEYKEIRIPIRINTHQNTLHNLGKIIM